MLWAVVNWLLIALLQSLLPAEGDPDSQTGSTFSIGFTDLNGTVSAPSDNDALIQSKNSQ